MYGIEIKDFTSIGANTVIIENNHNYKLPTTYFIARNVFDDKKGNKQEEISKGKITIEEGVWVGSNAVILSGVTIGRGAIIGAGSVVTHSVEPYSIYVGNPARMLKMRFSQSTIEKIESTEWWNYSVEQLFENKEWFYHRIEGSDEYEKNEYIKDN